MMKRLKLGLFIAICALSQNLFAHGESKLGPHKGYIRMPGTFHVEVIPKKDELRVMLLDANFKNPTVLNSHIKVRVVSGNDAYVLRCESMSNYFSCPVSNRLLKQNGMLKVESERQMAEGRPVEYPLPLRLQKV